MGVAYSRHYLQFFPPAPTLTEKNVPSQKGRVFIVTGGYSGCGYELSKILYQAGGKVYVAGHGETKALKAIEEIRSSADDVSQAGQIEFLFLELDDFSTIKASVEAFQAKESRLDVLWNNAGVTQPPVGTLSKQGIEIQMAVNALGPYLFTQLLIPSLKAAAELSAPGFTRVVWTSSQLVDVDAPTGGIDFNLLTTPSKDQKTNYTVTKTGNWFLASEFGRDLGSEGILSITQNPGNLYTAMLKNVPWVTWILLWPILYHAKFGGYTELYAGLSPDIKMENNGSYVVPWGKIHPSPREDILSSLKRVEEGGTGKAAEFRAWCEKMTADYR